MKLIVGSDFHGNEEASWAFYQYVYSQDPNNVVVCLLGDYVDYGPRPLEVMTIMWGLSYKYRTLMISGNHEHALFDDAEYQKYSSQRGKDSRDQTLEILDGWPKTIGEIKSLPKEIDVVIDGRRILLTHGIHGNAWKAMTEAEQSNPVYDYYDLVLTGHSHVPRIGYDDMSDTVFVNPGSVGQDRSRKGGAHFAVIDLPSRAVQLVRHEYDVEKEISKYGELRYHEYYRERLRVGT